MKAEAQSVERAVRDSRRLDIQGLRAVAVLMVVAFHAGLPVPGGFVGVDVFFVISGFVITGMIHRERSSTGRFRLGQFYLRRFKRLTPALALMVAVTMVLSFCLLSPLGAQQIAAPTGAGAMLLIANFVIPLLTGGYFDPPAESNPLLHTWTLSVEEQFYLIFPAILLHGWALSRRARRIPWVPILVGAASLTSLWLAVAGAGVFGPLGASPATYLVGFYGPFARAWEFAVGALLALAMASRNLRPHRFAQVLAWLGLGLIAASALLIDHTTVFPGLWTLLPVGGTVLVIAGGTNHSTGVNRILTLPAIVKMGDWSYSIYLWHWPLKVFAVLLWPEATFVAVLAVVLSVLPAAASYRWVEQPLRRLPPLTRRRTFALVGAVVCLPIFLATTVLFATYNYWIPRYKSGAVAHQGDTDWADFFLYVHNTYYPCSDQAIRDNAPKWGDIPRCFQSQPGSNIDVALVGDSHAETLFLGLADALPTKNVAYYGAGARTLASNPATKTVIVSVAWALHDLPGEWLVDTLKVFTSTDKTVFVTDDIPQFPFDALGCKYRKAPILPFPECSDNRQLFDAQRAKYDSELRAAVEKVPGVQLLNTAEYFCDNKVCSMNKDGVLLYRDSNHLNNIGSRFLANRILTDFPHFRAAVTNPE
ncbi:acyltransferase family protein [Mycobacterium sp. 663a-19]|uniref:acyltransferase family protein n=1 Tax=Mycobacterium sp. 663a-19 TaxID=2986148 RepID=UPI002D1F94FD|nr:acyltransferase family protein [Mycobacterium sp. 663a-19]MEB3983913.1 acyltransferase family protein [Mycobacterium sp. 663a-19]